MNWNKNMNYSKFFYVIFEKNNNIEDGVHMPLFSVQTEPKIHYSEIFPNKQKNDIYYTFIIVDPDAPTGPHIHQCIYNIPGDKVQKGTVLLPYYPPTPPKGSGEHRYFCILYEQSAIITKTPVVNKDKRAYKNFDVFKKKLGTKITPIASKFFICHYEVS